MRLRQAAVLWAIIGSIHCSKVLALTPEQRSEAGQLITRLLQPHELTDRSLWNSLSQGQQENVVAYLRGELEKLRKAGPGSDESLGGSLFAAELAVLGDQTGLGLVGRAYCANPCGLSQTVEVVNSPKMIALIGETLFKSEELFSKDTYIPAGQEVARKDVLYILANSHGFNDAVESWAKAMGGSKTFDPAATEIMRKWYRDNEAALKTGDFKAVKPGEAPALSAPDEALGRTDKSSLGPTVNAIAGHTAGPLSSGKLGDQKISWQGLAVLSAAVLLTFVTVFALVRGRR